MTNFSQSIVITPDQFSFYSFLFFFYFNLSSCLLDSSIYLLFIFGFPFIASPCPLFCMFVLLYTTVFHHLQISHALHYDHLQHRLSASLCLLLSLSATSSFFFITLFLCTASGYCSLLLSLSFLSTSYT